MKKIIPFRKEIIFKTNLAEITSISLEHSLHREEEHLITGSFFLKGEYKITDASTNSLVFSYDLPFDIHMDDHYILDHATVDIDDFYYEIVNENVLAVSIDVKVDKLEEKPLIEEAPLEEPKEEVREVEFEQVLSAKTPEIIEEEKKEALEIEGYLKREEPMKEEERDIDTSTETVSLFGALDDSNETYMTYRIYIIREGDSIESILTRYDVTREDLAAYNDLSEVKLGDKLIIPAIYHATSE